MMEAVHRYEGTVNQVMGDGIMALFGAPLAHEDHAVRACYAALRMQEAIRRYADEIQRTTASRSQIRVGLNSGEVVVRSIGSDLRMDYTAVGQTTHLAARMEQMAKPGSTCLTAETLRLAEGYVQVSPLGPVPVKGLAGPSRSSSWPDRRRRTRSRRRRPGDSPASWGDGRARPPRQALDQARGGQGQVVAVVGEPGCGKSRLVWEFIHSHRTQGWLVLESSSVSYGKATPICPSSTSCKRYFRIEDATTPAHPGEGHGKAPDARRVAARHAARRFLSLLDVPSRTPRGTPSTPGSAARRSTAAADAPPRARSSRSAWSSRTSTGSMPRPRPCSTAWSRACRRRACSSRQLSARVPARLGGARPTTASSDSTRCRRERGRAAPCALGEDAGSIRSSGS